MDVILLSAELAALAFLGGLVVGWLIGLVWSS